MISNVTATRDRAGHVIVCGLQGVGLSTVEQLHLAGVEVVVVDDQHDARLNRIVEGWGLEQIPASAQARDDLAAAGLAGAIAVVCADDELRALEIALVVKDVRPDARVVVELANDAVGRAVAGVTGPGSVLSMADLAAPSVVEACLQRSSFPLVLGGVDFAVADVLANRSATLRELYAELVPIAVVAVGHAEVTVCPGRDHPVRRGDAVRLVGRPDQLDDFGLDWRQPSESPLTGRRARALRWVRHAVASVLSEADRPLRLALCALAALVVVATTVLVIGYRKPDGSHMSVLDGIYFSVETIGTIGYGDFFFADQATWLRVFAVGLMMSGVVGAAVFFALLTNLLVSRRLAESFGLHQVVGIRGHVVVVGIGSVGVRVIESLLAQGREVVAVDRDLDNRHLARVRRLGVPVVIADVTLHQTLADVNIAEAAAVAVLTSDDLANLETGLAVRDVLGDRWPAVPVVLRLFDRDLAHSIEREFGFHHVRSTAALAAPWFVGAALGMEVLSTFYVERQPLLVARLPIAVGGGLDGLPMSGLSGRIRVLALARAGASDALEYPPRRDTRFAADDVAYLLGPYEELLAVLRRDQLAAGSDGPSDTAAPGARHT